MIDIERAQLLDEHRPADTGAMHDLCRRLTRDFLSKHPRALLLLSGEPGAGKTTFCQAFGPTLGIEERIQSPTFNILNEYRGSGGDLYHYDLYRLSAGDELLHLDFLERWQFSPKDEEPDSGRLEIHAVEWFERAAEYFPVALPTFLLRIEIAAAEPTAGVEFEEDEPRVTRLYRLPSL